MTATIVVVASVGAVAANGVAGAAWASPAVAGAPVNLSATNLDGMVVDDEHGHVLIGDRFAGLLSTYLDGGGLTVVDPIGVWGMFLDPATDALYLSHGDKISIWDTATLTERASYPSPTFTTPGSLVAVGDRVWFAQLGTDYTLRSVNLTTGATTVTDIQAGLVKTIPGHPGLLVVTPTILGGALRTVDVSSGTASVVATASIGSPSDVAVTADGEHILASGMRLKVPDLTVDGGYPAHGEQSVGVGAEWAASGDWFSGGAGILRVHQLGATEASRVQALPGGAVPRGLAWSQDDTRLYVVLANGVSPGYGVPLQLLVLADPQKAAGAVTATMAKHLPVSNGPW
jgi:hypothetical protein